LMEEGFARKSPPPPWAHADAGARTAPRDQGRGAMNGRQSGGGLNRRLCKPAHVGEFFEREVEARRREEDDAHLHKRQF